MGKKMYVAVASAINHRVNFQKTRKGVNGLIRAAARLELQIIAEDLATIFKADNGAFRHDTFMSACGFGDSDETNVLYSPEELAKPKEVSADENIGSIPALNMHREFISTSGRVIKDSVPGGL